MDTRREAAVGGMDCPVIDTTPIAGGGCAGEGGHGGVQARVGFELS